jgi:hypothetical protein
MFKAHLRYLAAAFVDAESVRPNQQEITDLINEFRDLQLVPAAVQEASPLGQDRRIAFVSPDSAWQIFLLGKRFQVARASKSPLGEDLGDFPAFCEQANKILKWALKRFERRPHRLAGLQEGVLSDKPDEEMSTIARHLFVLPPTFKDKPLDEWDWRASTKVNRRIGDLEEATNTIVTLKRLQGTITNEADLPAPLMAVPTKFALIRADIDINTVQDNTAARFQDAHMDSFFKSVGDWHKELAAEINGLIKEG